MPPSEKLPALNTAPPTPSVSISPAITRLRESEKSTLWRTMPWMPTPAIVPNSISMMPPSTACGMLCRKAPTLPSTENAIAASAVIRSTDGSVTRVICTAPVTSLYVVTGGPPASAPNRMASASPSSVRCSPGLCTKSRPATCPTT